MLIGHLVVVCPENRKQRTGRSAPPSLSSCPGEDAPASVDMQSGFEIPHYSRSFLKESVGEGAQRDCRWHVGSWNGFIL